MRDTRISRWGKECTVGFASAHGFGHGIIDFQYNSLGTVLAVFLLVFALDEGEGLHDVVHVVAGDANEI